MDSRFSQLFRYDRSREIVWSLVSSQTVWRCCRSETMMVLRTIRLQLGIFVILSEDFSRKNVCISITRMKEREKEQKCGKIHPNSIFFKHPADIFHILFQRLAKKIPQNWLDGVKWRAKSEYCICWDANNYTEYTLFNVGNILFSVPCTRFALTLLISLLWEWKNRCALRQCSINNL